MICEYKRVHMAAASHLCPWTFRCVFRDYQHHGFTLGADDMLRRPPYLSTLAVVVLIKFK